MSNGGKGKKSPGGVKTPPKDAMNGICRPGKGSGNKDVLPCEKKHWIKALLRHKDDETDVAAARCEISRGGTVVVPGPLVNGVIEGRELDPGAYELSFPDVDAGEWDKG